MIGRRWLLLALCGTLLAGEDKYLLIKAALDTHVPKVALAELKKIEAESSKEGDYWYYLGTTQRELGKVNEAMEAFERGIELAPEDPKIYAGLGLSCATLGDFAKALNQIQRAIDLDPANPRYHTDLGVVLMLERRADLALKSFETSYKLARTKEGAWNLAMAYCSLYDYQKAKEILMVWYPLHEVYYKLGEFLELESKIPEAVEMYKMSVSAKSDYLPARNKLKVYLEGDR